MFNYNQKVLDAFAHPKNVGVIENADGEGMVGNATCGDIMKITLKIENDVIVDAKFQTFGYRYQQHRYGNGKGNDGGRGA